MRQARFHRKTKETELTARIAIEGSGKARIRTGIPFINHMLEAFALHGGFDLEVSLQGDLEVDLHHSVEDLGIGLGNALEQALGKKKGIARAGFFFFPMDEALAFAAVDLCSRPYLFLDCSMAQPRVGTFSTDLVHDFFQGMATALGATLHLRVEKGRSAHHQIEALFKAFARALKQACRVSGRALPSTKGAL